MTPGEYYSVVLSSVIAVTGSIYAVLKKCKYISSSCDGESIDISISLEDIERRISAVEIATNIDIEETAV